MSLNINLKKARNILLILLLYISLPVILFLTNPQNLPVPLLILPIVLLFMIIFATVYFIFMRQLKRSGKISRTRLILISAIIAIVPVLLLVLASIRQFTVRDIILSIAIVISISWYLLKVDFLKT